MIRPRLFALGAVAAAAVCVGGAQPASALPGGPCNGTVDTSCTYVDSTGGTSTCKVWALGHCQDREGSITVVPPGGTCDGLVDAGCTDGSGFCTLWVVSLRCVIG